MFSLLKCLITVVGGKKGTVIRFLKLINNSSSLNKGIHGRNDVWRADLD